MPKKAYVSELKYSDHLKRFLTPHEMIIRDPAIGKTPLSIKVIDFIEKHAK